MKNYFSLYLVIPAAFIIGSIPFGVLITRTKGIDLQKAGSGNIGATNVLRTAGKIPALITLLGDALKGAAAVLLCRLLAGGEFPEGLAGITVVLGHMYSIFLSFKGGKGVATGFGVMAVYGPMPAFISFIVWLLTALSTRYSSVAAITAFLSLPVFFALLGNSMVKIFFAIVLGFLIILKHKQNIKRLIEGTETKIGEKTG